MRRVTTRRNALVAAWLCAATVGLVIAADQPVANVNAPLLAELNSPDSSLDTKLTLVARLSRQERAGIMGRLAPEVKSSLWREHFRRWHDAPGILTPPQKAAVGEAMGIVTPAFYAARDAKLSEGLCKVLAPTTFGSLRQAVAYNLGTMPSLTPKEPAAGVQSAPSVFRKLASLLVAPVRASGFNCTCYAFGATCCPSGCSCYAASTCDNYLQYGCGCGDSQLCTGYCGGRVCQVVEKRERVIT